jgi:hypothetical protein
MAEDLYNDAPEGAPQPAPTPDEGGGKTCLLPKSAFPEAKPGDKISVSVVRVHEQEIEVEPAGQSEEKSEDAPQEAPEPSPEGGGQGGGMASMLED